MPAISLGTVGSVGDFGRSATSGTKNLGNGFVKLLNCEPKQQLEYAVHSQPETNISNQTNMTSQGT